MINEFKHRCVRDLAWVIASPPLVSGIFKRNGQQTQWWTHEMCSQEFTSCLPALRILDQDPQALVAHLESIKSKRLGLYFEGIIAFWLSEISLNFTLLARNIQLNEIPGNTQSRTIGEVDFIIKEIESGKLIHLEVAVKFYLGTPPFEDPFRWFGTNTHDQLGKKIKHLQRHQTQLLLQHPQQVGFTIDERHCLLKGRLFYPFATDKSKLISPKGVANTHLRGRYYQHDGSGNSNVFNRIVPLEKSEWLAELMDSDIAENDIFSTFVSENRARCYAALKENEQRNIEAERIFYLPGDFVFPSF